MTDSQPNGPSTWGSNVAYRAGIGLACATGFVLLWINAAAGIIGDGPVNLMYLGVVAVGVVGAYISNFGTRGMALTLYATAVIQMIVPVFALAIMRAGRQDLLTSSDSPKPPFDPGVAPVFGLDLVFAALWVVSALLIQYAGRERSRS